MDKYRRIPNKPDAEELGPDEVRITARGRVTKYVEYALKLLKEGTDQSNGPLDTIVIKAAGRAINKAVLTVEIVKRRVKGLHQENELKTLEMKDRWEPMEQGLHEVITTRRLPYIIVTLSRSIDRVNTDTPGYQEPLPDEIVDQDTQAKNEANTRRTERRRSGQQDYSDREERGGGRGPGQGRGGRGQGRRRGGGGGNQQSGRRQRRRQGGGNQQGGGGGGYERGYSQGQQQGRRQRGGGRYNDDMDYEDDRGQYNQFSSGRQRRDRQDGRRTRQRGRGGYRGGGQQGGNFQGRRGGNGGGGGGGGSYGYNEDQFDGQGYGGGGGRQQRGGYNQRRQRGPRQQQQQTQYGYAGGQY